MKKEEILKMSQQENRGKLDERESAVTDKASRIGMTVGAIICLALVFISKLIFHAPEIALSAWLVYMAMNGSSNIALYFNLKTRSKLVMGIIYIIFAIIFAVELVIKTMG